MQPSTRTADLHTWSVSRWRVEVQSGPSKGASRIITDGVLIIGSDPRADLEVADPTVSREHLRAEIEPGAVRLTDLKSKNGTHIGGVRIDTVNLPFTGAVIRVGESEIGFFPIDDTLPMAPSSSARCGRLLGQTTEMRLLFAQIERVAQTRSTVLIQGETGSGKELVAEAIHEQGARHDGPFVVVDCGSIPRGLIEGELFGHARGAFTGAVRDYVGAFERAQTGTIFLDEIAEIPLDLQARLLRVIESRQLRPIGQTAPVQLDVRVIAATHRDLRQAVQAGEFRQDLYFRLAVVQLDVPPLRARLDDLPLLAEALCRTLGAPPLDASTLARMAKLPWPGNVRQLRNVIERAAATSQGEWLVVSDHDVQRDEQSAAAAHHAALELPYKEAKELIVAEFTRDYLAALLRRNHGNVSAAAREANIDRSWIIALARRHGVRVRE